jgi:hypothetical protein
VTPSLKVTGSDIWFQRFLSPDHCRLFDASTLAETSLAAGAFWSIESRRDRGADHPKLGSVIAEIVAESFDGMLVLGVRGSDATRYHNVVLFRPEGYWRDLVDRAHPPTRTA